MFHSLGYFGLYADLLVKNVSILHIITDKVGWPHDSGFDADPVQRKHEWVKLLHRKGGPAERERNINIETWVYNRAFFKQSYYLRNIKCSVLCVYYLGKAGLGHVKSQESDPVKTLLISWKRGSTFVVELVLLHHLRMKALRHTEILLFKNNLNVNQGQGQIYTQREVCSPSAFN